MLSFTRLHNPLFDSLMNNEEFSHSFYDKLLEISELFNPQTVTNYIEEYRAMYTKMAEKETTSFHSSDNDILYRFNTQLDEIEIFFFERYVYFNNTIGNHY